MIQWQPKKVKVSQLKEYEGNPRDFTEKGMKELKASIQKFGIAEPICCNPDLTIVSGYIPDKHGRKFKRFIKKCVVCDKYYILPKHLIPKRKYCSHKCGAQIYAQKNGNKKREIVIERNKDIEFRKKVSAGLKIYHKNHPTKEQDWFIKIYGKNYKPKSDYYIPGGDWRKLSNHLINKYPCNRCGTTEKLNVHHIVPYSISRDNSLQNLVVLCKGCHKIVEMNNLQINRIIGGNWEVLRCLYKRNLEDRGNGIYYE